MPAQLHEAATTAPPTRIPAPPLAEDAAARTSRQVLALLFGPAETRSFAVRLWNGAVERGAAEEPPFTLVLRHPGALRRMFIPPTELNLAESYLRDDFDIEGRIERATLLADEVAERIRPKAALARVMQKILTLPTGTGKELEVDGRAREYGPERPLPAWQRLPQYILRHSKRRDSETISFAYDTSNEFYALWLDERMQYTCAYFRTGTEDIHQAQVEKLDLVCRKLRIRPGDRLLDIGCGWGGLLKHAVENYGAIGYGVTLSKEQAAWANESFARAGIADRCSAEVRDYRDIPPQRRFDKISAVGVVEHVGVANLAPFYAGVYALLEPGGLFLNHLIITILDPPKEEGKPGSGKVLRQHNAFIQKYIFPDAEMPTIGEVVQNTERAGFEVRDVESLREHYATTFRHWLRRFEARADEVKALLGESGYRAYRLYMAAFPPRFEEHWCGLSQVLLSRNAPGGRTGLPPGRDDIYFDAAEVLAR
jgi:cyclopropane-fatty-acyl-phospholipid synthase